MLIIRVHGEVIGVGFRATTQRLAKELHLNGYVRNMPDGTVEIGLDASQSKAKELIEKLESASFTRIDQVSIQERPGSTNVSGFQIN